ncbi:polyprenyl synthetase family protein [Nocardia sp. CWNU-33]|uniref:polyprenyl synthetase family protein n=1 Tax=Nocardia sp. CWNU-33 TaxID=3392117 RepID=UPI00398F5C74
METLPAELKHVVGYHVGWWDAEGRPDLDTGKAVRPALVLASARAVARAADVDANHDVVKAAVAMELIHDFTLLHDDVMDGDRLRRHRPTAWVEFGTAPAVVAGDALLAVAIDLLAQRDLAATAVLTRALRVLCEGQCADLVFESMADVDVSACLRMASNKTGTLLGAACELGALMVGATADRMRRLNQFGRQLGLAYQLADDLLGIWGDPEVTGKPVYSDLVRRKKSLPAAAALQSDSPAGREFAHRYSSGTELEPYEFDELAALIELAGGRRWAEEQLAQCCDAARASLAAAQPDPARAEDLVTLVDLVTSWR